MVEKIKLAGGPEKTVTWMWIENHRLKVEFYDFSELAQRMFGNDIAYILTVEDLTGVSSAAGQKEETLIPWMTDNFKSYFEIKRWLEENKVGFSVEIDSWA